MRILLRKKHRNSRPFSSPGYSQRAWLNIHLDTIDRECNRAYRLSSQIRNSDRYFFSSSPSLSLSSLNIQRSKHGIYLEKTGERDILALLPDKNNKKGWDDIIDIPSRSSSLPEKKVAKSEGGWASDRARGMSNSRDEGRWERRGWRDVHTRGGAAADSPV